MTRYLIAFDDGDMVFPREDLPVVAKAVRAVEADGRRAGVWVFAAGLEHQDPSVVADQRDRHRRPVPGEQGAHRRVHGRRGAHARGSPGMGRQDRRGLSVCPTSVRAPARRRLLRVRQSVIDVREAITRAHHQEWARLVAALTRRFGDLDVAEEAAAEAFAMALARWPVDGIPPNPGAWLTTTAKRKAIDRLRREHQRDDKQREAQMRYAADAPEPSGPIDDDRLRLVFTCCHPALAMESRVALTLRMVGGLTMPEIARAFLVSEVAMGQRITRAKAKIKAARIPFRVPAGEDLPGRLSGVLAVLFLVFNEGYLATGPDTDPVRHDLTAEAIRLTRLVRDLVPEDGEVAGLLALMLLTEARGPARVSATGELVTLDQQDRAAWDPALIAEGHRLVRERLATGLRPGRYQLLAAINAVHTSAGDVSDTDWWQVVALYDQLIRIDPSPIVALNRAIAVAELDGPDVGLAAVDRLEPSLAGYHAYHATRADLLRRVGRRQESRAAYAKAIEAGGQHGRDRMAQASPRPARPLPVEPLEPELGHPLAGGRRVADRDGPEPGQRRQHQEQDRDRHPGPADEDPAAHADHPRDGGRGEGPDRIRDPVREHLERGVDAAKDPIRAEALDQRQLRDPLDRLEPVPEQLRDEDHDRREQDRSLGQRGEDAEGRRASGRPDQRRADPQRADDARREQRADERSNAARRDHDAEHERRQVQLVDQVDRVQDAIERPSDVGDDRTHHDREEHRVVANHRKALDDLVADRRRRGPRWPWRLGRPDEEQRYRRDRERAPRRPGSRTGR